MRQTTALPPPTITPYQRRYLGAIRDLMFHSQSVHTHLDWHETDQWLDTQDVPMRLAWQNGRLVGFLATSPPLHETCWVRLAAVADRSDQKTILSALWNDLIPDLRSVNVKLVALLAVQEWISVYMPELGFHYVEDIITLARSGRQIPSPRPNHPSFVPPTPPIWIHWFTSINRPLNHPGSSPAMSCVKHTESRQAVPLQC